MLYFYTKEGLEVVEKVTKSNDKGKDLRVYLQMIENVINKMSSNSFLIRGWGITVVGGLMTVFFTHLNNKSNWFILILCFAVCVFFWINDAYYLYIERKFRTLYSKAINNEVEVFTMDISKIKINFFSCMFSFPYRISYLLISICMFVAIILMKPCHF